MAAHVKGGFDNLARTGREVILPLQEGTPTSSSASSGFTT
jgi:hypothetical protein